jgi:hypothetical protein
MRISDLRVIEGAGTSRLVADVTTRRWPEPFSVWFDIPRPVDGLSAPLHGDPWLAALLLPAMRTREPLHIDAPVSPELHAAVAEIQAVYAAWLPSAEPVEVRPAEVRTPERGAPTRDVGLFFSCGVDSWYSLLQSEARRARGRPAVTHLVFVHGFDIDVGRWKSDVATTLARHVERVADHFGLAAIPVSTNVRRYYTRTGLSWRWGQAGALAAIALALRDTCATAVITSGDGYSAKVTEPEVEAGGCHPLLLPMWSTRDCDLVVSAGAITRLVRVAAIAESQLALNLLRVCWDNAKAEYNCGRCAKCVATTLELAIVGAIGRCSTLPSRLDPPTIRAIRTLFPFEVTSLRERHARLAEQGAEPEVLAALQRSIERSERDHAEVARALDAVRATVAGGQPVVLVDDDDAIRFELGRTHHHVIPFTEDDGFDNGFPVDDAGAVAELERVRAGGAERLVVWHDCAWALDHYATFGELVRRQPVLASTPEVTVFDLAGNGTPR